MNKGILLWTARHDGCYTIDENFDCGSIDGFVEATNYFYTKN